MQPGDSVQIKTKDKEFEGVLMPNSTKTTLFLKLDSGYNVGIEFKNIKSKKVIIKHKPSKDKKPKVTQKNNLKKITILHTGGTIASAVDYKTGAVKAKFTPEDMLTMFPELKETANISSRLVSNMFSEDLRFAHYNILAKEIEKEIKKGTEGIIITHGTDTMHYTSAALAFILEDLPIPVLLVGAQRSSDRGSSDAGMNLICAARFIVATDYANVGICMHSGNSDDVCVIIPGTRARKFHSSRRDAFKSVNVDPIAEVGYKSNNIHFRKHSHHRKVDKDKKLKLKLFKENLKVGILKVHPQMFASELEPYTKFNGLIIEGTGLGHVPINVIDKHTNEHKKILSKIKLLAKKLPVVMASQTIFGRIDMNVYSTGVDLQEAGVLGNFADMTPETSFIKLAWLLSNYPKDVRSLITENFRGEISKRDLPEGFLE